tara:strand:+ start:25 stop:624 length:600 start_codon:yes stop_codon:yes gene_type:complete
MHINRFKNHLDSMARSDRFNVEIRANKIALRSRGLRVSEVNIPGKTMDVQRHGFGGGMPDTPYITGITYENEVTMKFLLDTTMEDKQLMELWQSYMFDEAYNLQYPENYHGTVIIEQLGVDNIPVYSVELHDAFPTVVTGLTMSAGSTEVQTFDVTFNYRTWSSSFENSPSGLLGGLFNKKMRKIRSKLDNKIQDKLFG